MNPDPQPPPSQAQAPAKDNSIKIALIVIAVVFGSCGLCAVLGGVTNLLERNKSKTSSTETANIPTTGNVAHDQLLALGPNERAVALAKVVGEGCVGEYAFFMGLANDTKNAFWSVRCTNGKSYEVQVSPDAGGSTRVLECDVLQALTKIRCFEKLQQ
jgi:hypothetical protein